MKKEKIHSNRIIREIRNGTLPRHIVRKEKIKSRLATRKKFKGSFSHHELIMNAFYEMEITIHMSRTKHLRFE